MKNMGRPACERVPASSSHFSFLFSHATHANPHPPTMSYPTPPTGLPSTRKPFSAPRRRGLGSKIKSWLGEPFSLGGRADDPPSRGSVLVGLAAVLAAAATVALYDRRYAVKAEMEEGVGSARAELKAAGRDAKSSAGHLKGAVSKAVYK